MATIYKLYAVFEVIDYNEITDELDTLEQRHKFIEAQRESGGVYNQVS